MSDINLTSTARYFDLSVKKMVKTNRNVTSSTPITLVPCEYSHWSRIGDQAKELFDLDGLPWAMCLPDGVTIDIQWKPAAHVYKYLEIKFKNCTVTDCETETNIDDYIYFSSISAKKIYCILKPCVKALRPTTS